jgi:hypothetical protein
VSGRSASALVLALGLGMLPAEAQTARPDITGRWLFETGKFDTFEYSDGCIMSGEMTIRSTPAASFYACSFTIETICKQDGREAEYYRVRQACSASRTGGKLSISSKIEKIEETRLNGQPASLAGYTADMFYLSPSPNGIEMTGQQFDAVRRTSARFWRDQELVS